MINVTKHQHFVPKYYLKNFAYMSKKSGRKRKYYVHTLNSKSGKSSTTTTDKIAYEDHFYEAPSTPEMYKDGKPVLSLNEVEDFLSKLESMIAPYLDKFIITLETDTPNLSIFLNSNENRMWIGLHYLLQFYRSKNWKQNIEDSEKTKLKQELIFKELYYGWNESRYKENSRILNKFSKEKASWEQIIKLLDIKELNDDLNILGNFIWAVGENSSSTPLITSDCPINFFDYFPDDSKTYKCSSLPLTPKYILIIYHENLTNQHLGHLNNSLLCLNEIEVKQFNKFQNEQCSRMLFSNQQIIQNRFN